MFYRIGEVASLVGVEPYVLRYWETEFKSIRPRKSAKGQRVYSRNDVEKLHQVKELLYAHGFTIAGARKKLREGGYEPPDPAEVATQAAVSEEAKRMREVLLSLRGELVAALDELERF
jgi:DNA-binding transcriptional MerR regulator